jgi:hypothetical protein
VQKIPFLIDGVLWQIYHKIIMLPDKKQFNGVF